MNKESCATCHRISWHANLQLPCRERLADPTDLSNTAVERPIDNTGVSYEFSHTYLVKEERTVMNNMAEWVKAPASKSDDLSSIPGICMVEEESSLLQTVFRSQYSTFSDLFMCAHTCTHIHTQ